MSEGERLRDDLATAKQDLAAVNDQLRRASERRVRQAVHLAAMKAVSDTLSEMKAEAEEGTSASPRSSLAYAFALEAAMAEADRLLAMLDDEA
jgi:hypothetical protein